MWAERWSGCATNWGNKMVLMLPGAIREGGGYGD